MRVEIRVLRPFHILCKKNLIMRLRLYHLTLLLVFMATLDYRFFANVAGVPSVTIFEMTAVTLLMLLGVMMLVRPSVIMPVLLVIKGERLVLYYLVWAGFSSTIWFINGDDASAAHLKDILPAVILFYMVATYVRSEREIHTLLKIYLIGISFHLLLGLSQIVFGGPRPLALNEGSVWKTDVYGEVLDATFIPAGLFTHPNGYALFLIPAFLLLVALIMYKKNYFWKLASVCLLILLAFVAWEAQVKGMFIWISFGTLLLLLPQKYAKLRIWAGFVVLLGGIVSIIVFTLWYFGSDGTLGTMQTRYDLWEGALTLLSSDTTLIMLGGGVRGMTMLSGVYSNMEEYPSSHNTFLDQIIVFGLPALLIYANIGIKAMRISAYSARISPKAERTTPLFLHAALVALLGAFFFEPALGGTMLQAQFFLLCAMSVVIHRQSCQVLRG